FVSQRKRCARFPSIQPVSAAFGLGTRQATAKTKNVRDWRTVQRKSSSSDRVSQAEVEERIQSADRSLLRVHRMWHSVAKCCTAAGPRLRFLLRVVCHECSWSIQLHATVQEMKEGPSGSAIMG